MQYYHDLIRLLIFILAHFNLKLYVRPSSHFTKSFSSLTYSTSFLLVTILAYYWDNLIRLLTFILTHSHASDSTVATFHISVTHFSLKHISLINLIRFFSFLSLLVQYEHDIILLLIFILTHPNQKLFTAHSSHFPPH